MISATFSCEQYQVSWKKNFCSPWETRKSFNMPGKKGLRWSDLRENYKEEVNWANEGDCMSGSQVVIGTWLIFSALGT